jgi:hypothetical protein
MRNSTFSLNRVSWLIRRQLAINVKNLIIALAACFGALLVISILIILGSHGVDYQPILSLSATVIFIGGYIFTSNAFNELHSPDKAYQYLTLPATTLEKLASVWIMSAVFYSIVSFLLTVAIVLLGNVFAIVIGVTPGSMSQFQSFPFGYLLWIFVVGHSVFLLGSCYFRKNNFLKTLLAVIVIGLILSIYAGINGFIFFGKANFQFNTSTGDNMSEQYMYFIQHVLPVISKILIGYLIAPFFILVSYYVLKERQV